MEFCDTHAHLHLKELLDNLESVMKRAFNANVKRIYIPNLDSESIPLIASVCSKYPNNCFAMTGLHPGSVKENFQIELEATFKYSENMDLCAIGEIGLDLYHDTTWFAEQKEAFSLQLSRAVQMGLPVVIHTRNALNETWEIVKKYPAVNGVFHCYSGNYKESLPILEQGFYLGIGGVVTFKSAHNLHEVVKHTSLDKLLLETDSPFLAPVPYRGKRNEPSYIPLIAAAISEIKGISVMEVAEVTTRNAIELFGK